MRIAFFTETFLPNFDGIVNTLCRLLEYLEEQGHQAIIFAPDGGPDNYAGHAISSRPGVPFPLYPAIKLVSPLSNFESDLNQFQPDIIHVLNPISIGLAGIWHARQRNLPLVASYHTDVAGYAKSYGVGIFQESVWAYLRYLHNKADLNLAPSTFSANQLQERGIERVGVWSRGVDSRMYHPIHRDLEMRNRLSADDSEAPLLLYVGRLSPEKRIEWLLPVLKSYRKARLAIVGDGPSRDHLQKVFQGTRTVFTGVLRGRDLAAAYASADIFAFPSASETFGNVVQEAMASGLPLVAADAGGPLDFVVHKRNGYLFKHKHRGDFKAKVRRLLKKSPEERRAMGMEGRRLAMRRSWDHIFGRLMQDYVSVIQQHGDRRLIKTGNLRQYKEA